MKKKKKIKVLEFVQKQLHSQPTSTTNNTNRVKMKSGSRKKKKDEETRGEGFDQAGTSAFKVAVDLIHCTGYWVRHSLHYLSKTSRELRELGISVWIQLMKLQISSEEERELSYVTSS